MAKKKYNDWNGDILYEVPQNWEWVKLEALTNKINYGYTETATFEAVGPHFLRITDLKKCGVDWNSVPFCKIDEKRKVNYLLKKGDVVIARMGSVGKSYLIDTPPESVYASYLIRLKLNSLIIPKYLDYFNRSLTYWSQITTESKGSTRPNVNASVLKNLNIPVAPLPEQQRIVNRIESLFEKIDKAETLINEAREGFEKRKEAILAKAFRGELTEKWREDNGELIRNDYLEQKYINHKYNIKCKYQDDLFDEPFEIPSCWKWAKLSEVGKLERGKSKHRPRNDKRLFGGEYPFIQTGDVARADKYILKHKQTLSELGINQSKLFSKGTLCITIAANIGDVAILSYDCAFPDSVVAFIPNSLILSEFVYYYLLIIKSILEQFAPATAQKNINIAILNEVKIPLMCIEEQESLIKTVDELIDNEMSIKDLLDMDKDISLIRKAILAKAFRGELGTNNELEQNMLIME